MKREIVQELNALIRMLKKGEVREFVVSFNGNALEVALKTKN
jgi:hypothetical protein